MNDFNKFNNIDVGSHGNIDNVKLSKSYKRHLIFKNSTQIVLLSIFLLFIALLGFVTILGPVKTQKGYLYPSEMPPKNNSNVVVLPQPDNFAGRLYNSFDGKKTILGKVIVGNYGTLSDTGGVYTVVQNNKVFNTSVKVQNGHKKYLDNEYIIKCTGGACKTNSEFLMNGNRVKLLK